MANNARTVVHKHQHITRGPGIGTEMLTMTLRMMFSVAMMTIQLVVWAVPVIVRGLVWLTINVIVPGVTMLADAVVRVATRASAAHQSRRSREGGGWR